MQTQIIRLTKLCQSVISVFSHLDKNAVVFLPVLFTRAIALVISPRLALAKIMNIVVFILFTDLGN